MGLLPHPCSLTRGGGPPRSPSRAVHPSQPPPARGASRTPHSARNPDKPPPTPRPTIPRRIPGFQHLPKPVSHPASAPTADNRCGTVLEGGGQPEPPHPARGLLEVREAPCERETGSKKLPAGGGPNHSAELAKYLQRDSCGRTKPLSSAPQPKIWAPRGDRAPTAPLPGTRSGPPAAGGGPGETPLSAPSPCPRGAPGRPRHLRPPAAGARLQGTKGAEDSPQPRRRAALAA